MNRDKVIECWINGESAFIKNNYGQKTLWTNGHKLFSYSEIIGYTTDYRTKVVIDRRGNTTRTTACHVGKAIKHPLTHSISEEEYEENA